MNTEAREQILASIRKNKPAEVPHPALRDFTQLRVEGSSLDLFKKHLKEAYANYYDVNDTEDALRLIKQLHPDAKVICSATPEIEGNRKLQSTDDPHSLEDVDVGIMRARFGIAENGAVWLTQEDMIVDALGFLSQHLIILLDPNEIVGNMHGAYKRVEIEKHNYGCFMMGPSATADISAVHIDGAQGARTLNVFLMKPYSVPAI
jgi:L-lactate dehydrogenase complex protein LldG